MDISWIFGHARTEFFAPTDSLSIPLIASPKPVTLLDLCKSITPPCVLNPLLFNGHLQTIWTAVKSQACPLHYRRRIFSCPDPSYPGTFAVDFATDSPAASEDSSLPPRTTHFPESEWTDVGKDTKRPLLIALHGLSGGSHELYLRHVLAPLVDPAQPEEKRWDALVVNARGCAMSKITTGVLFNARATWDAREVVRWARETWPDRKIFAVGFSLGANILTNVGSLNAISSCPAMETVLTKCDFVVLVSWRGRGKLHSSGCCCVFQSMESRAGQPGIAEDVDGKRSLLQNDGW